MPSSLFDIRTPVPKAVGTGLLALDVLLDRKLGAKVRSWAGGSCGNVLAILAYLGWQSYPISRIGRDRQSEIVLNDVRRWGVMTDLIYREKSVETPIVVERLSHNGASSTHTFEFRCPNCGAPLPKVKSIPDELLEQVDGFVDSAQVCYFDRVSEFAINLAARQRSRGALVIFEPSRTNRVSLFRRAVKVAHIVKYSRDQIDVSRLGKHIPLEIQTMGAEGLRYSFRKSRNSSLSWRKLPAYHVPTLVDSAGAGDWCTAGIVHAIGQQGSSGLGEITPSIMDEALSFGQGLAALCCTYEGARGPMYNLTKSDITKITLSIISNRVQRDSIRRYSRTKKAIFLKLVCTHCSKQNFTDN